MIARYSSASIDSSDGLAVSLYELASQSKRVDIAVYRIPAVEGLDKFARENGYETDELVFHGGEEYEIVATIPPTKIKQAKAGSKKSRR